MKMRPIHLVTLLTVFTFSGLAVNCLAIWNAAMAEAEVLDVPIPSYSSFPTAWEASDLSVFRSLEISTSIPVDFDALSELLAGIGWEPTNSAITVQWRFQMLTHPLAAAGSWPESSVLIFVIAREIDTGDTALLRLNSIHSDPAVAAQLDALFTGGTSVGHISMEFETKDGKMQFNGRVKEPGSGLDLRVNATFPLYSVLPSRRIADPLSIPVRAVDFHAVEPVRPAVQVAIQEDIAVFNKAVTEDFAFTLIAKRDLLSLPGGYHLPIVGEPEVLLRFNGVRHFKRL